jgi:hypothetical protein
VGAGVRSQRTLATQPSSWDEKENHVYRKSRAEGDVGGRKTNRE